MLTESLVLTWLKAGGRILLFHTFFDAAIAETVGAQGFFKKFSQYG